MKRGQVTIFIVLGLILVIIIGLVFFLRSRETEEGIDVQSDERFVTSQIEPVKTLVVDCVDQESIRGLKFIGKQGGYYDPVKYENVGDFKVAYGCYISSGNRINNLPLLEQISDEFDEYMNSETTRNEIDRCINNFKFFTEKGLSVKPGSRQIESDIQFNKVGIDIDYPLVISRGEYSANVDKMFSEIYIGLGKLHKIASDIVNEECTGNRFDIDQYIKQNEPLGTIEMQYYQGKIFVYLSSIIEGKEEPIDFHFVVENA